MATNPLNREENPNSLPGEEIARIGSEISPEARAVLRAALSEQPRRSLFEVLSSMPNVGEDSDYTHSQR